jgi:ferric-dicitrate binding protein FerR (iron transport regulator)
MTCRPLAAALALALALALGPALAGKDQRPFAEKGFLEVPAGREIRMGDASGGLAMIAAGGTLLKRQGASIALERGRLGVALKPAGNRAMRVTSGKLTIESRGGRYILQRTSALTRLQVLEGKATVTGAGPARAVSAWQQLDVTTAGKVGLDGVDRESHAAGQRWLGAAPPPAPPPPAPRKRSRKSR